MAGMARVLACRATLLLAMLVLALCAGPVRAQPGSAGDAGRRVALVIGNQAYRHVDALKTAAADAKAMTAALRERGFEVLDGYDLDRAGMNRLFNRFESLLATRTVAVLYFAGHGVQVGGANVLLPVDARPENERDLLDDGIRTGDLMERMAAANGRGGGGLNLLILDACRDNPFRGAGGRTIGTTRGLNAAGASGVMVLYAAGTNQRALDDLGPNDRDPNGVFTRFLLRAMRAPGLPVRDLMQRVRREVADTARNVGRDQVPAIYDEALGDFVFTPGAPAVPAAPRPTTPADHEALFWQSVIASGRREDAEAYLRAFPNGTFVPLARSKLDLAFAAPPAPGVAASPRDARPSAADAAQAECDRRTLPLRIAMMKTPSFVNAAAVESLDGPAARTACAEARRQLPNQPRFITWLGHLSAADRDYKEAARLYGLAAAQGDAEATFHFALMHEVGIGGLPKDEREAVRLHGVAADKGYAPAQYRLGAGNEYGQFGLAKNEVEAARQYRRAAEQFHAPAQASLGWLTENGAGGLARNEAEAVRLYVLSADQGNARGQVNLGFMWERGRGGLAGSDREAARLYRLAAAQGSAAAQFNLGNFHRAGRGGLAKDDGEAARFYNLSVNQGFASAQVNLGVLYEEGAAGFAKDDREAVRLYGLAAAQGNANGQVNLARMHEAGRGGLARDEREAVRLFRLAAEQGNATGKAALERLKTR